MPENQSRTNTKQPSQFNPFDAIRAAVAEMPDDPLTGTAWRLMDQFPIAKRGSVVVDIDHAEARAWKKLTKEQRADALASAVAEMIER